MTESEVPFIAVGNEELRKAPFITKGDPLGCPVCNTTCIVKESSPGGLQYIKCNTCAGLFLVGLYGKKI